MSDVSHSKPSNMRTYFSLVQYRTFTDAVEAKKYVKNEGAPIVVKADGLAAGKGVVVAMTLDEAFEAIDSMLVEGSFGSAGSLVIIEEFLEGEEASFFALVDGTNALPLESAQDHKRVGDGDVGPNTGGMGAYSPAPIVTDELKRTVMESIIIPTVKGMSTEGCKFVGVLYAGLMIEKKSGLPKLIEYNVRFGDPECQVSYPSPVSSIHFCRGTNKKFHKIDFKNKI
jgi:phosphoribosylamine---glycine ligase